MESNRSKGGRSGRKWGQQGGEAGRNESHPSTLSISVAEARFPSLEGGSHLPPGQALRPLPLQPGHRLGVQVVSGLIQQQDVGGRQ